MNEIDPSDVATQERAQEANRQRLLLELQQHKADVQWLMSHESGRRLIMHLLNQAGVYRSTFSNNALDMAFNEGSRNIGLQWMADLMSASPEMIPVMMSEAKTNE